jgi:hypothetical protein
MIDHILSYSTGKGECPAPENYLHTYLLIIDTQRRILIPENQLRGKAVRV